MLELKNICAGYGKNQILADISLSFPKSKFICIIGPNGSGKSTLLKTAMGIIPILSGEVYIDSENVNSLSRRQLAERMAYLSQGKNVPDMTVGQLVMHGRFPHLSYPHRYSEKDKSIVSAALNELGISGLRDKPLFSLSGGMRQNAYIAMALAQDAEYILLDEPTSYLDISHQLELMKSMKKLTALGKGVVSVLHDLPLAFSFSDYIVVLNNGVVVAEGTPEDLYNRPIIREVFGIELDYSVEEKSYRYKYIL